MRTYTKMYLMICLSTACIFLYQYQLSRARLISQPTHQQDTVGELQQKASDFYVSTTTNSSIAISPPLSTSQDKPQLPPLYIITPTFRRPEQLAELTRLGYTLKHVPNLLWLVIEDAEHATVLVTKLLEHIGVPFVHLVAAMPEKFRKNKVKPRGVSNRNRGLKWIRANATEGVFYFADDDNTYDVTLFEQIRYTKKVSMWPVGLITKYGVSSPIVRNGTFAGFYDGWIGGRKYAVDMAGFAVSVQFLISRPKAEMPFKPGYEEDGFLKSLNPLDNSEIELLASGCTEILTWHTQTKKNQPAQQLDMTKYRDTNLVKLRGILV
uniref:Galactosylgalactosylxylosylprotein 3-beta-glucuronosyltransferase n=1 Tax=Nyssomyia neivai TaxID=330878 RepID=A0A1L8E218_9DIPT